MKISISAIILTYNEEKNIEKCLKSISDINTEVIVVDSYSTDNTLEIVKKYTNNIYQHEFKTHNIQWKWALENLPISNEWVLGLDADQTLTEELKAELINLFKHPDENIDGYYIKRKQYFLGKWIRYGGYYPKYLLKLFKKNKVFINDEELVDHHFYVNGRTLKLKGDIIEDNINERNLDFWIEKHITYSNLMAKEKLSSQKNNLQEFSNTNPDQRVLFYKSIYINLPLFLRSFLYFIYRYFIRFGFLDGKEGLIFHFLQGFWFRFLVDAKIYQNRK